VGGIDVGVVDGVASIGLQPIITLARAIRTENSPGNFNMGFPFLKSIEAGDIIVLLFNKQWRPGFQYETHGFKEEGLSNLALYNN
jgi:hypothetical protein